MLPIGKIKQIKNVRGVGMGAYSENNPLILKEKMRNYIIDKVSFNENYNFIKAVYDFIKEKEQEGESK